MFGHARTINSLFPFLRLPIRTRSRKRFFQQHLIFLSVLSGCKHSIDSKQYSVFYWLGRTTGQPYSLTCCYAFLAQSVRKYNDWHRIRWIVNCGNTNGMKMWWLIAISSTHQHVIDKLLSFGEHKLRLLQSVGFQCFADQFSGTDEVLFHMRIL